MSISVFFFFFFNDTASTEIYTLSLHDALPILAGLFEAVGHGGSRCGQNLGVDGRTRRPDQLRQRIHGQDRKSTRLNSSHGYISYAVFCLKKKKKKNKNIKQP